MQNLVKTNISILKTLLLGFFLTAFIGANGQQKDGLKKKLFKRNKASHKVEKAKLDSIKTIYQLVKSRQNCQGEKRGK